MQIHKVWVMGLAGISSLAYAPSSGATELLADQVEKRWVDSTDHVSIQGIYRADGAVYEYGSQSQLIPSLLPTYQKLGSNTYVRKFDSQGNLLWSRAVDLSATENGDGAVKLLKQGKTLYVLAQATEGPLPPPPGQAYMSHLYQPDVVLLKLSDLTGAILSSSRIATFSDTHGQIDKPVDLAVDSVGNTYVIGLTGQIPYSSGTPVEDQEWLVAKIDAAGVLRWKRTAKGSYSGWAMGALNWPTHLWIDEKSQQLVVLGNFDNGNAVIYDYDPHVRRYSMARGDLLMAKDIKGVPGGTELSDCVDAIRVDGNTYLAVNGSTPSGTYAYYAAKLDSQYNVTWISDPTFSPGLYGSPQAIALDGAGFVYLSGTIDMPTQSFGNSNQYIAKISPNTGATIWERNFEGSRTTLDNNFGTYFDGQGSLWLVGMDNNQASKADIVVRRLDSSGGLVQSTLVLNGAFDRSDIVDQVFVDQAGLTLFARFSETASSPSNRAVVTIRRPSPVPTSPALE